MAFNRKKFIPVVYNDALVFNRKTKSVTRYKPPSATKREYKKIASTTAKAGISSLPLSQSTPSNAPQPQPQRLGPVSATTQPALSGPQTSQWLPPFPTNTSITSTQYIAPIRPPMLIPSYPTPIITRPFASNTSNTTTASAITYNLSPHPASNTAIWEPHKSEKAAQTTGAPSSSASDLTNHLTNPLPSPSQFTPL